MSAERAIGSCVTFSNPASEGTHCRLCCILFARSRFLRPSPHSEEEDYIPNPPDGRVSETLQSHFKATTPPAYFGSQKTAFVLDSVSLVPFQIWSLDSMTLAKGMWRESSAQFLASCQPLSPQRTLKFLRITVCQEQLRL